MEEEEEVTSKLQLRRHLSPVSTPTKSGPQQQEKQREGERTNRPRPGERGDPGRSSSPGGHPDYPDRGGRREKLNNTV